MDDLLLATKLYLPPPRRDLVRRPRLTARLDAGLRAHSPSSSRRLAVARRPCSATNVPPTRKAPMTTTRHGWSPDWPWTWGTTISLAFRATLSPPCRRCAPSLAALCWRACARPSRRRSRRCSRYCSTSSPPCPTMLSSCSTTTTSSTQRPSTTPWPSCSTTCRRGRTSSSSRGPIRPCRWPACAPAPS